MRALTEFDLHRRRSTGAAPVRSEIEGVLAALLAEGVRAPAEAVRAMELLRGVEQVYVLPDVGAWIAAADLDALDPAQIMDHLRADLASFGLHSGGGSGFVTAALDALVARATASLIADLDRIFNDLRPAWDAAADVVHAAAATGISSASTAADVIAAGDAAVAAYRQLAGPLATLDRIWRLRNALLFYAGFELPEHHISEQRWLDRCAGTPAQLTIPEITWQQAKAAREAATAHAPAASADTDVADADTEHNTEHEIYTDTYREAEAV